MTKITLALVVALGGAGLPSLAATASYDIETMSFPGDNFTQLLGITMPAQSSACTVRR